MQDNSCEFLILRVRIFKNFQNIQVLNWHQLFFMHFWTRNVRFKYKKNS